MSVVVSAELAQMTEEVTSSKVVELTDIEMDAVAGGMLAMSREKPRAV
ncbi:hypothetical protein QE385_004011 [Sphingomonas sp. SORGH_AS 950]|nr:hypothetical protein [Sphingomonas sp. SORGH_AS_0950]MDQ1159614.1 hypothetical protein [Sphingomonas sp. SORGH_AS_0950]